MSFYAAQLAEHAAGSEKGPSFPEPFQYLQAAVGPVGQRGPQGNDFSSLFNNCKTYNLNMFNL
jgi:hypothetical protein